MTERADIGLQERRQDLVECDVEQVRAVPVAPADMQPHPLARNAGNAGIDRRDVPLADLDEFGVATCPGS